jgi:copper chaperone CopZ
MAKKIRLNVMGMHCSSCEMLVKDALEESGASNVVVSHKKGLVDVEFDEKKLNESTIRALIKKEGYNVK